MDPREPLIAFINTFEGRPQAAEKLGIPYSTLAAICNGTRGVGKDLAQRLEERSGGALKAEQLIWIRPITDREAA